MGVNGEAMELNAVTMHFVKQVTQETVSGTTNHMCCIRTCKEIEGLHDKIIITIVTSYVYQNKVTLLLLLALLLMLCTPNNTDDNKLTRDVFQYSFVQR